MTLRLSDAQKSRLLSVQRGSALFRSPFNRTDYALADRGLLSLQEDTKRSAGPGYFTTSYYRSLTDAGRQVVTAFGELQNTTEEK
jgi:hypothetical protein